MAESAFNFNSAPGGKGRQFGAIGAVAKMMSGRKSHESGHLSARDQSHLSAQSHAQNKDLVSHTASESRKSDMLGAVVNSVIGGESSKLAHKQSMAKDRQTHKQGLEKSSQEHLHSIDNHVMAMNSIHSASQNPAIAAFKTPNGTQATFRAPDKGQQFDGQSET